MIRTRRKKDNAAITPTGRLTKKASKMLQAARVVASSFDNKMFAEMYIFSTEQAVYKNNYHFLKFIKQLREPPVDIETFLDSKEFMGATDLKLWPEVRRAIINACKYWWKGWDVAINELLLMGATGTGKSEIAKICTAYHLHILGCMRKPQRYWGLPEATSIVMTIQAAKPHVTKKIIYLPLRVYIETMPWFQRHMRPNKILEGEMYFDSHNIRVVQGGADSDAVLGDALIGGVTDEINFMNVVEKSKKAGLGTGRSGNYDQAQAVYDTITRRKKSRFMSQGPNVGIFCIASSTRYKNDFTDRRKQQVERLKDKTVYVYDKAQYEVRPAEKYCGDKFRLLIANEAAMDIRILEDEENVHGGTIIEVPVEYKEDFEKDPSGALRDIVGRSVNSINPFFRQQAKIIYCVTKGEENGLKSFLHKDNVVLGFEGMPVLLTEHYCTNPSKPRYVHIDLSNTGDSCGLSMVRYDGIEWVGREGGEPEALPIATVEMAVGIQPDHGHEIDIAEVRSWVKMLRTKYGYPIRAVTYDGWQSIESMQAWKKQGMKTGLVSVDRTSAPYKQLRDAIYDGRLFMYNQPVLIEELFGLEYDEKKDKIDHPITGSKDVADAVCGAYHTLLTRSSSWVMPDGGGDPMSSDRADMGDRFDIERSG